MVEYNVMNLKGKNRNGKKRKMANQQKQKAWNTISDYICLYMQTKKGHPRMSFNVYNHI